MEQSIVVTIIITIVVWFLIREINCWYWKINETNSKLDRICVYLETIIKMQKGEDVSAEELLSHVNEEQGGNIRRYKSQIKYADGSIYNGEVRDGLPDGRGKMINNNGEIFEGQYVEGKPKGKGVLTEATGEKFNVVFKDGRMIDKKPQ